MVHYGRRADYLLPGDQHRVFAHGKMLTSLGCGLSLVKGSESEGFLDDGEPVDPIIGFPLEGQIMWRPLRFLGLGVYGIANFNSEKNLFSIAVNLQLGRLR